MSMVSEVFQTAFFLGMIALIISVVYLTQIQHPAKKAWKSFADDNNLKYASTSANISVSGKYKGHTLEVEITLSALSTFDTQVTVHINETIAKNRIESDLENYKTMNYEEAAKHITALLMPYKVEGLGELEASDDAQKIIYRHPTVITDENLLWQVCHLPYGPANNYHLIVAIGGRIVPVLQTIITHNTFKLRPLATQLVKDIAEITIKQLADKASNLFCTQCIAQCAPHEVTLPREATLIYYACGNCFQSHDFFQGEVIAILDSQVSEEIVEHQANIYHINWLIRRRIFDFSSVKIIQASDEEVERFAMQVGNDTSPFRQKLYKKMACTISPTCELSPNTLRILKELFGDVKNAK